MDKEIIKKLQTFAESSPATETPHYLVYYSPEGDEQSDTLFCRSCAAELWDWLTGNSRMLTYHEYMDLSLHWEFTPESEIDFFPLHFCESDSTLWCELCGCLLESSLSEFAIKAEVLFFDHVGIRNGDDAQCILMFFDNIHDARQEDGY